MNRMWEIREGYTGRHYGMRSAAEEKAYECGYDCGYEEGYAKAMEEMGSYGERSKMRRY